MGWLSERIGPKILSATIETVGRIAYSSADFAADDILENANLDKRFADALQEVQAGPTNPEERQKWIVDHGQYLHLKLQDLLIDQSVEEMMGDTRRKLGPSREMEINAAIATVKNKLHTRISSESLEYTSGNLESQGVKAADTRIFAPAAIAVMAREIYRVGNGIPEVKKRTKAQSDKLTMAIDNAFITFKKAAQKGPRR